MRFSKFILIGAASLMLPILSQASSITSNPTLSVSGLTFNDFSCSMSHQGAALPGNCSSINVNTISQPATGLQFSSGFIAAGNAAFDDAVLNYHVTSTNAINAIGLSFNGFFDNYAIASVTETVMNSADQIVGFAKVSCGIAGCTEQDTIALNGSYTNLYVTKDINVTSLECGSFSALSYVDQTFDPTPTPEPASFAMIGAGLVGLGGLLRRRAKKV